MTDQPAKSSNTKSTRGLGARQIIEGIRNGDRFECHICGAMLETVPGNWTADMPLHGIVCPNNTDHLDIHLDDADLTQKMRERMRGI